MKVEGKIETAYAAATEIVEINATETGNVFVTAFPAHRLARHKKTAACLIPLEGIKQTVSDYRKNETGRSTTNTA